MPTKHLAGIAVERIGRLGKLVVSIKGRPIKIDPKKTALLACLYESLGCVVPYGRLSDVVGCKSLTPHGRQHTLRQHLHGLKNILNGTGYVITVCREIGYALCPLQMEQQKEGSEKVKTPLMALQEKDVVALLRAEVQKFESVAAWARHNSLDRTDVSSAIHQNKPISRKMLRTLGLRKAVVDDRSRALDATDIHKLLSAAVAAAGSQSAWAEKHQIDRSFINKVLRVEREPSEKIVRALGLRFVMVRD